MAALIWILYAAVFADEVLCAVAAGVAGAHWWGVGGAVAGPVVVVLVWWLFASPQARFGGHGVRPVVKVIVFVGCSAALYAAGHQLAGVLLLVFSLVVNGVAQIRPLQARAAQVIPGFRR